MDRNDGNAAPLRRGASLERATVRELIVQPARAEEATTPCNQTGVPDGARDLAERGRAIVQELCSRASEAERDSPRSAGEGVGQ